MKIKFLFLFIVITSLSFYYYDFMQEAKTKEIENLAHKRLESVGIAYKAITSTYNVLAQKLFYDTMHNEKVMNL
jgi:hypothetical protein